MCLGWSVKDLALHLLGDDIGLLSRLRDAVGVPGLEELAFKAPVLETFVHALPRAFAGTRGDGGGACHPVQRRRRMPPGWPWQVLGTRSVDAGDGWLIFALPPAELAVHPAERAAGPSSIS